MWYNVSPSLSLRSLLTLIVCSSYQSGPMPEVALSFLNSNNPRDLNMSEGPNLAKLKKFFSGVLVTFTHRKGRKKIDSIVPRAGSQQFEWNKDKNDGVVQNITIQVLFLLQTFIALTDHCT